MDPLHLSLLDLKQGQCRFPFGDRPFTFCGCAALEDKTYCEAHYALTHVAPTPVKVPYFRRRAA